MAIRRGILMGVVFLAAAASAALADDFSDANARYQAGDFKTAVEKYESVVKARGGTASIYYNLGNAYFRLGQKGKARLSYERALSLSPRDRDIRWNLDILKGTLEDRIETAAPFWLDALDRVALFVTADEAALLFSLSLFLLALSAWGSRLERVRRAAGLIAVLALAMGIFSSIIFFRVWVRVKDPRFIITAQETPVRYGPSDKETKAFVLHAGAAARLTDRTKDWVYVALDDKRAGWVPVSTGEML